MIRREILLSVITVAMVGFTGYASATDKIPLISQAPKTTKPLLVGLSDTPYGSVARSSASTTGGKSAGSKGAMTVAAGCLVPPTVQLGKNYYIDPDKGDIKNNGSQAYPWDTLRNVLAQKKAILQNGDTLNLYGSASGKNHGAVMAKSMTPSGFILIRPVAGQRPLLQSIDVRGSQFLIFQGLKVQSYSSGANLVAAGYGSHDIIFDGNIISSQDSRFTLLKSTPTVAGWDRASHGFATDGRGGAKCITATNNQISNVGRGVALTAGDSLFANNTVDEFIFDGLDFAANNLVISGNKITNGHDDSAGRHHDCMQGQIGGNGTRIPGGFTYKNITIDSNICINQTYPGMILPGVMQGISAFDSNWDNVKVTNNVIVANSYHGMRWSSVHGGLFANNTVVNGSSGQPGESPYTSIGVGANTHDGTASSNVTVKDNLSQALLMNMPTANVFHNMVGKDNKGKTVLWIYVNGVLQHNWPASGVMPGNNVILPTLAQEFIAYDRINKIYNLHLKKNSPAVGYGAP